VQERDTEDGDDRIADELLDSAAVSLEDGPHLLEVPAHDAAKGLGVESLAEGRRTDDVGEDDGDGFSHLARADRHRSGERRTAGEAEARLVRVLLAAFATDEHAPECMPALLRFRAVQGIRTSLLPHLLARPECGAQALVGRGEDERDAPHRPVSPGLLPRFDEGRLIGRLVLFSADRGHSRRAGEFAGE
jgi:hypothetical protein